MRTAEIGSEEQDFLNRITCIGRRLEDLVYAESVFNAPCKKTREDKQTILKILRKLRKRKEYRSYPQVIGYIKETIERYS